MPAILPLLCLLIALAGCAGQQQQVSGSQGWRQHSTQMHQFTHWRATGKLAVRTPAEAESASLVWVQDANTTSLSLSGPLGMGAMTVESDGRYLQVSNQDETSRWDISAPGAIAQSTGWDLPLQSLPHWLKGIPAPGVEVQSAVVEGDLLRSLQQDGWQLIFQRYQQFGEFTLPTRLSIERGSTNARIILRQWDALESL